MTTYSLVMSEQHLQQLQTHLLREDGHEHAAYLLCNKADIRFEPWNRQSHEKFVCAKVIPVPDDHVVQSTANLVTWTTTSFVAALREAEQNEQIVCVVHNHPAGMATFSAQDDANEPDLVQLAVNRNGEGTRILSLVLTADKEFVGRIWTRPESGSFELLQRIVVVGDRIQCHYRGRAEGVSPRAFDRQALAFGSALNRDLQNLRVSIVGCGGTGSAVAMLLARMGVGHIALIDNDIVEETNLNRLHGARQADADAMRPKVDVVAGSITELGIGTRVVKHEAWVGDPECLDTLKASDIIFGCTDDHDGRLYLNRFAYFYLTPVIDIGLAIQAGNGSPPELIALDGRVTVLTPPHTCLVCRGVINSEVARAEELRRNNPDEYEKRKAEAYVLGEGNPSPAVVTFTTELACMGVNELIHRLQGFRGENGSAANRVRKFHLMSEDRQPGHKPGMACSVCGREDYWGRGDMVPHLGRVG